ncbi:DNA-binding FrmR family transcriptional regulator [Oikeobacillus pervagus]|uniref:DNA-binding FrmR family transcriptional regulator n=1 Tax=Oikeobacillus pervagus TaxID=1325931 RepID=A0AAJ1T363_9BACI|nr:metal-sensitive transcriptional regulator [Oikeobacillus pervagus]MDQ0215932.1 DNA-binding FrmR family transcriptional regulator [Oikeobacillus pervagus]
MKYNKNVQNRLKRMEGQVRGVIRMMEEDQNCADVVTQLSAIKGAIDRTIGIIVSTNLEHCVRENIEKNESTDDLVKEAVHLLVKSR